MCNFKILHHCENGYVVLCEKCERFQLAFGTSMVVMDRAEFQDFRNMLSELVELNEEAPFPECKNIYLPTPSKHVYLVFSPKEVEAFCSLLDQASLLLEANEILCNA